MDDIKYSIIIPCFNESENIPLIINRFKEVIKRDDIEIILVDNGSTDNTQEVIKSIINENKFLKTVKVETNQGYGFGILSGLKEAKGEFLGWTHADMQTDPQDVIKAIDIAEKETTDNIYVKGSRKNRPFFDVFFTFGMGCFETLLMGQFLWDINAQPNLFPKKLFENWENPPYDFALDLFALYKAKKQGYKVIRFPVIFPDRIHGESHWNTGIGGKIKFIKRTIDFSFKLKKGLKLPPPVRK